VAAPAAAHHEQVEQKDCQHDAHAAPSPKISPRCSIDTGLTSSQAMLPVSAASSKRHRQDPVAAAARDVRAALDPQPARSQPARSVTGLIGQTQAQ
jgi:hypothetical protein